MTKRLLLLPGDGIGPEVSSEVKRTAEWFVAKAGLELAITELAFGGASYDQCGSPLSDEAREYARSVDAVIMGAVGGPKWTDVPRDRRPEAGLLQLRTEMEVFANLRPVQCFDALADASTLKPQYVKGLDILIVRELTGGIYFGQPQGIETLADGSQRAVDTQVYTTKEIVRVARVAFALARQRGGRVMSVEKSNVMMNGLLWRQIVSKLHKEEYSDLQLSHMYADNCAMQLVRNPRQFDVILTDNLFGDILSDAAAMVSGSLGMLASAALGEEGRAGLYEPIHGSAPDIAGQGVANPLAAILSLAMALRWSLSRADLADRLVSAVTEALDRGALTRDLGGTLSTSRMGDAVLARLDG
jgi:3-isopropylmalate dehydrogenase